MLRIFMDGHGDTALADAVESNRLMTQLMCIAVDGSSMLELCEGLRVRVLGRADNSRGRGVPRRGGARRTPFRTPGTLSGLTKTHLKPSWDP